MKKVDLAFLYDIEQDEKNEKINSLKKLLEANISEADLDCISLFLYEKAYEVFTTNSVNKNTIPIYRMLYRKYIKRIIENIGDSEDRYNFVDYIIKIVGDTNDYEGAREELFNIITYVFDHYKFNNLLSKSIDFKRLKNDEAYARKVEDIFVLFEEYNYYIRDYRDVDLQNDREYGMKKMLEYIKIREKNNPGFYNNSILIDYLLLHSCEIYSNKKELESGVFEIIKKCVDDKTKQEDFNIFTDHGISDLFQIINSDRINIDQVKELSEIINRNLKINKINVQHYLEKARKLMQKEGLKGKQLKDLFRCVQKIRIASNGNIPTEIIDYLITEMFNEKSALYKQIDFYKEHICRIFESFGIDQIPKKLKEKKSYFYFTREFTDSIESMGVQTGDIVFLCEDLSIDKMEAINTIFHENTHLEQDYIFHSKEYPSYPEYMALKESILCDEILNYQINNYDFLFLEINAREKANLKMLKYFLKSDRIKKYFSRERINELIEELKKERTQYIGAFSKVVKEDEGKDVNILFSTFLKKEWLERYPILSLEFNDDCRQKTPKQVIEEIEQADNIIKRNLLINILKNNGIFNQDNIYDDAEYLINYTSENKQTEKIISHVIASTFIKILYSQYERFDELSEDEKKKFSKIINMAQMTLESKPNSVFSKGINKKDSSGTKIIKTFDLIREFIELKAPVFAMEKDFS